jgi:hypothetical protein
MGKKEKIEKKENHRRPHEDPTTRSMVWNEGKPSLFFWNNNHINHRGHGTKISAMKIRVHSSNPRHLWFTVILAAA